MRRLPLLSVVFALVVGLTASSCGNTIRPAAATVNGEEISQEALDAELQAIKGNAAYVKDVEANGFQVLGKGDGTLTSDFVARLLSRQIFLFLVRKELLRRNLRVTADELDDSEAPVVESVGGQEIWDRFPKSYQQTLKRRNAEVVKLQDDLGGAEITDEAIKAFYEANPERFAQTCVSHILFGVAGPDGQLDREATAAQLDVLKGQAATARAEIAAGADFAEIAKQRSVDTSNKDQGGDLECGGPGRFVPEFETAMDALQPNEVSDPVPTQFGVHIIKVTGRPPQPLEEATPAIVRELQSEDQAAFSEFLQDAVAKSKISVNPRYGTFRNRGDAPGVVPPGAPTTTVAGDEAPVPGEGTPTPLAP